MINAEILIGAIAERKIEVNIKISTAVSAANRHHN